MKNQHYFITLRTEKREPYIGRYPDLERITERAWNQLMKSLPGIEPEEFGTRRDSLIAIVRVESYLNNGIDDAIAQATEFFVNECHRRWRLHREASSPDAPEKVWQEHAEIKHISTDAELTKYREYILQNMLGAGLHDGWD